MNNLKTIFNQHIINGLCQGAEWKIKVNNKVFQDKIGHMHLFSKKPIKDNTIYRIWSMTKPIVSVASLQLVEEKKISLLDPITKFLPQFSNLKVLKNKNGSINDLVDIKTMPTIKDLLLHTAGFSYNFIGDTIGREYDRLKIFYSPDTTLAEEINTLSKIPLLHHPSEEWNYSVAIDVLARIIEVVENNSLQNILSSKIFIPLGMNNTGFSVSSSEVNNIMDTYEYNEDKKQLSEIIYSPQKISGYSYPSNKNTYARGGHGLFSTLEDYFIFSEMLLSGKTYDGKKILSKALLKESTSNHLDSSFFPLEIKNFDRKPNKKNDLEPYGWGFGFRVLIDNNSINSLGNLGEFGWGGAASTFFIVDPKENLNAVLMTQVLNGDSEITNSFFETIYKNLKLA